MQNRCNDCRRFSAKCLILFGWGTWIRTKIDGVRVRSSTVELFPKSGGADTKVKRNCRFGVPSSGIRWDDQHSKWSLNAEAGRFGRWTSDFSRRNFATVANGCSGAAGAFAFDTSEGDALRLLRRLNKLRWAPSVFGLATAQKEVGE